MRAGNSHNRLEGHRGSYSNSARRDDHPTNPGPDANSGTKPCFPSGSGPEGVDRRRFAWLSTFGVEGLYTTQPDPPILAARGCGSRKPHPSVHRDRWGMCVGRSWDPLGQLEQTITTGNGQKQANRYDAAAVLHASHDTAHASLMCFTLSLT